MAPDPRGPGARAAFSPPQPDFGLWSGNRDPALSCCRRRPPEIGLDSHAAWRNRTCETFPSNLPADSLRESGSSEDGYQQ